jgi:hypothetical protein
MDNSSSDLGQWESGSRPRESACAVVLQVLAITLHLMLDTSVLACNLDWQVQHVCSKGVLGGGGAPTGVPLQWMGGSNGSLIL